MSRYSRQVLFPPFGTDGQARVARSHAVVAGCGGLGATAAELLARAGVGRLRIVDRDVVELSNLQRQSLFDEQDVRERRPKAVAAARRIFAINPEVQVQAVVADLHAGNVRSIIEGADIILDGLDNFEGRYLVNDACVEGGTPWVYAGSVGATAVAALVVPGTTACLRCLQPEVPAPGSVPTCDTTGILGPAAHLAASLEAGLALRWLATGTFPEPPGLVSVDVWDGTVARSTTRRAADCACCTRREFPFLETGARPAAALCGRDAVHVRPSGPARPDFDAIARRLAPLGEVAVHEFTLRFRMPPYELTLFDDGRTIVKGTGDEALARSLVARYLGT